MSKTALMKAKSPRGSSRQGALPDANVMITVGHKAREVAAAASPIADENFEVIDLSDIPETDFAQPTAVRGQHYVRFLAATDERDG